MAVKSAGQIVIDEVTAAVESLKACVAPIFDVNEDLEAELLGSAVLIEVGGAIFLCTAKHVIAANARSTLYIDGPSKMEILQGDFWKSDEHDVAVLKLTSAQRDLLKKYTPLPADRISILPEACACKYACLVGFPETKNRKVYDENKIKGLMYSVGGTIKSIDPARVRVAFRRQRNIDAKTRLRVAAPDPHGISGGAIFGISANANTIEGRPRPKLIGIITDCPPSPASEIFGPSMTILMAILGKVWKVALPPRLVPTNVRINVVSSG